MEFPTTEFVFVSINLCFQILSFYLLWVKISEITGKSMHLKFKNKLLPIDKRIDILKIVIQTHQKA